MPDQPVYAALVSVREAVKCGDKKRILRATLNLTETFLECVREAFRLGIGESPWAVLARQPELSRWAERLEKRHFVHGWPDLEDEAQMTAIERFHESCSRRREQIAENLAILL